MSTIIEINNLSKSFKDKNNTIKVLDNLSLTIEENDTIAIVGPSGSGKTTLLNIIGMLQSFENGKLYINGSDSTALKDEQAAHLRNQLFGYVAQDFALIENQTAFENIRIPLLYRKNIKRSEHAKMINKAAEQLNIENLLAKKVKKLSGGERQRVAIARAIVADQKIILADEPTGALDKHNRQLVTNILLELNKQGKTIIVVTHDNDFADNFNRILHLNKGHLDDLKFNI